jgi:hypothetical protein
MGKTPGLGFKILLTLLAYVGCQQGPQSESVINADSMDQCTDSVDLVIAK